MKEFKILKLLDKISWIFIKMGVDYPLMRRILQLKLVMDERRVPTVLVNEKKASEKKNTFRSSLFVYLFMGAFIGGFIFIPIPLFSKMNIIIAMLLFMIMTTMISDFSAVLLDVEDKNILLSRPVDSKTLNVAKLIHIINYLFRITLSISGGTLVCGAVLYGVLFSILLLIELVLMCGLVIFFTSVFYYAILSFFNGEKLKDIINYFQIALTIFMTIIYQFIGRIYNLSAISIDTKPNSWDFLLPTAWFAAPFSLVIEHNISRHIIVLTLLGIFIPVIMMILYQRLVIPHFEQRLNKLNGVGNTTRLGRNLLSNKVGQLVCKSAQEKSMFRFTYAMLGNERKLKLRIYPMIAFAYIFPIIFIINQIDFDAFFYDSIKEIGDGLNYFNLYYSVAILSSLFSFIRLSENYQGAWIYKVLPIDQPSKIIKGALKAFILKFIIPAFLFVSILFVLLFGKRILPDLFLMFVNMILIIILSIHLGKKELPFYIDFQYAQNGNNTTRVLLMFLLSGIFAAIHIVAILIHPMAIYINLAISFVIVAVLWQITFRFTWKQIEMEK